jgi:hypothetical protein
MNKYIKRLQKREKRLALKTKNRMKWLWNLVYSRVRKDKGIKEQPINNPTVRKLTVLANRIYIRR